MTVLRCAAVTCMYNKDQLCSKGEIDVTGANAREAEQTSCGSFRERGSGSVTNSVTNGCGCEQIQIDCGANTCIYNEQSKCTASAIQVDGSNAGTSQETCCNTFQVKA